MTNEVNLDPGDFHDCASALVLTDVYDAVEVPVENVVRHIVHVDLYRFLVLSIVSEYEKSRLFRPQRGGLMPWG